MNGRPKQGKAVILLAAVALSTLALVMFVSTQIGSSGASFARVSMNSGSIFSAGTLVLINSKDGSAVVSVSDLLPGKSVTGTLTVSVSGNYRAVVTLTDAGTTDTPSSPSLSQALTFKVEDITGTGTTLYNSSMSGFSSVSLGTFASGTTRTYRFTVSYPTASAASGLLNATTTMDLRFSGVAQ
jgi:hypothetical protein